MKKPNPDPDVVRFRHTESKVAPSYVSIHDLSVADIQGLAEGIVPEWLRKDAEFWLTAKPGDVPKDYQTYHAEAAATERKSA